MGSLLDHCSSTNPPWLDTDHTINICKFLPLLGFEPGSLGAVSRWLIRYPTTPHSILVLLNFRKYKIPRETWFSQMNPFILGLEKWDFKYVKNWKSSESHKTMKLSSFGRSAVGLVVFALAWRSGGKWSVTCRRKIFFSGGWLATLVKRSHENIYVEVYFWKKRVISLKSSDINRQVWS